MKQHITVEQFDELGNKQRQFLRDWWRPQPGDHAYFEGRYKLMIEADSPFVGTSDVKYYPILSIGQMIEFLEDSGHWTHNKSMVSLNLREDSITNICDTLWEAVKEVLE